ncbi:MAG TPA: hypothetical protein VKG82_09355 [Solirubrobacteraceae bacterium]|nr:hypothetical protein [Solirubrobacteraceae bacterium]
MRQRASSARAHLPRPARTGAFVVLCTCLALALAGAERAAAKGVVGNSFNELTKAASEAPAATQTTSTTATRSESNSASTSNSHTVIWLGVGVSVVLLCGIGFAIARDARRVAPAGDADLAEGRSVHDTAVRLRKRRAKAKAARRQRKRNRA